MLEFIVEHLNISIFISAIAVIISVGSLCEMKKARLAQFRPFLSIRAISKDKKMNNKRSISTEITYDDISHNKLTRIKYPLKLMIRNVGTGPALHISPDSFDEFNFYFKQEKESNWISLSPNEEVIINLYINYAREFEEFLESIKDKTFTVRFKYNDTSGNIYFTKVKLEVKNLISNKDYPDLEFYVVERLPEENSIKNSFINNWL